MVGLKEFQDGKKKGRGPETKEGKLLFIFVEV
jgi:hypothetical protein